MIDSVAGSRGAFQFVASTSEVDELSDARLSIFIRAGTVSVTDRNRLLIVPLSGAAAINVSAEAN